MNSFFSEFASGSLHSPFWHPFLLFTALFGDVLVAAGVIIESWPPKDIKAKVGLGFVFFGVIISAGFTLFLFVFDEGISGAQQEKIFALEQPRNIDFAVFKKLMASAPITPVDIQFTGGGDTEWLANQLVFAFSMLKWPVTGGWAHFVVFDDPELCKIAPGLGCISAQSMGVTILMHATGTEAELSLRESVMHALAEAQIHWLPAGVYGGANASVPAGTLRVIVAPKP
jgi:hypothetical protein